MDQACIDFGVSETGCGLISVGMYVGYAFFFVALIALFVLPLMNALKEPRELAKSAVGVIGLLVLFGVAYSLSGDEVTLVAASYGTTAQGSRMIGAGLIMFYVVFATALLGLIYSFFHKAIK